MLILSKMDLVLNFKKENPPKTYRFSKGKQVEVNENVANYLFTNYKDNFVKVIPVVNTITNVFEKPVTIENNENNILNQLIEEPKPNLDIKEVIEKAIEQQIITKQGPWYTVEENTFKGILKVKENLEQNKELLEKIVSKLK